MSEKTGAKLPCPLCGEPLDWGASKCSNCGASVPKQTKDSVQLLMKVLNVDSGQAVRLYNLGYRKPDDLKGKNLWELLEEEPKLFLCPECGAFVHEKEQKCQRCGAEFAGEAMEIEDYLLREERPCPHCGESIHTNATSCPACGKPVAEAKGVALGSTYMCPSCGVTVLEGQKECEVCGANLSPTALIASKARELEATACPKCGGTLDPETGICPFCSKATPEATPTTAPEEGMEEIDQFLEHLASTPSGGGRLKPATERGAPSPHSAATEPPKSAVRDGEAIERPPEEKSIDELLEMIPLQPLEKEPEPAIEAEVEAALEELETQVKTLPMVKVLKPSYAKLPKDALPAKPSVDRARLAFAAELFLYATAVCLSLQYFAFRAEVVALEWGLFLFYAAALGMAVGFLALTSVSPQREVSRRLPQILGTLAIAIVPLHWYLGAAFPPVTDIVLIVAGLALWIPPTVRLTGMRACMTAWAGGSMIAILLMPATVLSINLGGNLVAAAAWASSAILVLTGIALSLEIRWMRSRMDASLKLGEEEFRRHEFRKSVEDYDRAIEMARRSGAEDLATPWYSKGAALVVLGRYEEALKAIDEALRINPNNELAWVNKGNALSRMGDYKGALKAFNAALRANPRYEVAWNNKGNTLARLAKFSEALKCYDLALQVDPYYRGAWVNKGYVLAKVGEFDEAAKCAEKVMSLTVGATS